ncbi:MAG: cell division protein FtsI/penicillin-binding protein 2 [Candidatus Azotimanducaceae bacterium]|jgi:cell division protein FtsI/penicillin-binding protein 2
MRKGAIFRIRIITGVVLTLALILVVRLYQVQVYQHAEYLEKGEQQYVHTVQDLYSRGSIFLTSKEGERVSAATVQNGFLLAIDPTHISDVGYTYAELSRHVDLNQESFVRNASNQKRRYIEIDRQISSDTADKIDELNLTGVFLYKNQWRFYPGDTLGARTIGFVGFSGESKNEKLSGRYGLERYYEDVLSNNSDRLSVNFFAEIFSSLGGLVFEAEETKKGDVVTSLEPTVLRLLQKELLSTNEKWDSELTGGIIINPKTGKIYALDAVPTFNANDRRGNEIAYFQNPLVENVYEFGSIIKALTMASGLDSGAVSAGTTYYDAGTLEFDTFTIGNFDGKGRGTVDMQEVLKQSLNTGVAFVVDTMGKERFRDYFLGLKLGTEAGIDLPNEAYGLVENLNSPRDIEYATASYGQGIALTPIAAVRALSALGNGGSLITPHLATAIVYDDGTTKEIAFPPGEQVFTPETSEEISRMLTVVVDEALRGGTVALPDYSIAAKTGTAQIADSENGGYYEDRFLHSFFGYFPSYDPEFLIFLYTVEPKEVRYASETLTEPFMELTTFLINYYNIPPDR